MEFKQALGHTIIVKQETPPERSPLVIIIPEEARTFSPFAKVVKIGKKVKWIKEGDEILMSTSKPEKFEHKGDEYGMININSVECKYENGVLTPFGNKMIIFQDDPETVTKGGIIIPDIAQESKRIGEVMMVGDECKEIKKGDRVYFSKMSGKVIGFEGVAHTIVYESDLQGKIVDNELLPLGKNVMVKQEDCKQETESGIIVNLHNADHEKPNIGSITAIGKSVSMCKIDDRVIFSMYAGRKLFWDEKSYILMLETEILGTVDKDMVITECGFTQDHNAIAESLDSSGIGEVFDKEYGEDRGEKLDKAGSD